MRHESGLQQPLRGPVTAHRFGAQIVGNRLGAVEGLIEAVAAFRHSDSTIADKICRYTEQELPGRHAPEGQIFDRLVIADVIEPRQQGLIRIGIEIGVIGGDGSRDNRGDGSRTP